MKLLLALPLLLTACAASVQFTDDQCRVLRQMKVNTATICAKKGDNSLSNRSTSFRSGSTTASTTGRQGSAGPAGNPGPAGPAGPTGAQGSPGAAGSPGPPGNSPAPSGGGSTASGGGIGLNGGTGINGGIGIGPGAIGRDGGIAIGN